MNNLFPIGAVTGHVLSTEGQPAAGISVNAIPVDQCSQPPNGVSVDYSAKTWSSGNYRLDGIPAGRYYITAGLSQLPTYYPGVSQVASATVVSISAGGTARNIDFALTIPLDGLRVSGRVIRPHRHGAIAGERVVLTGPGEKPTAPFTVPYRQECVVHPDGSFQFLVVRAGAYALSVIAAEMLLQPVSIVVVDKHVVGIELRLHEAVDVTAVVKVENEVQPTVALVFDGVYTTTQTITSGLLKARLPDGEYRVSLTGLPIGYTLETMIAGSVNLLENPLKISAGETPPQIVITLKASSPSPWVNVKGHVIDRRGPGSVMPRDVLLGGAAERLKAEVDGDGAFEFPRVLPGRYTLKAQDRSELDAFEDPFQTMLIDVGNKNLDGVEFVLPATRRIITRLIVEDGPIVPRGFQFFVTDSSGRQRTPGGWGPWPDGTIYLWLPDGEYRLTVKPPDEYALRSLTAGSTNLLTDPLKISASTSKDLEIQLTLRFTKSAKLSGRLKTHRLGDEAAAPYKINVWRAGAMLEWHSILTNADGTFQTKVMPGVYHLSVQRKLPDGTAPIGLPHLSTLAVPAGDKDVSGIEINMPRWKEVRGRLMLQDDAPPLVHLTLKLTGDSVSTYITLAPGPDGNFSATLPEGEYWCSVSGFPEGYAVSSATYGRTNLFTERLKITAEDAGELQIRIVPTPQVKMVKVSGRVVRPIASAETPAVDSRTARPPRISISGSTKQDALLKRDGSFEFSKLIPGRFRVQLDATIASAEIGVWVPGEGVAGLTLLAVPGRVVVEDGGRLPSTFFMSAKHEPSFWPEDNYGPRVSLQADGSFTALLVPGVQRISCSATQPFYQVRSISYGSTNVLHKAFTIGHENSPLELVIVLGKLRAT